MDRIFTYKDFSAPYDPMDYMHEERISPVLERLSMIEAEAAGMKPHEKMKLMHETGAQLLDAAFGDGTASSIIGDSTSLSDVFSVIGAFLEYRAGILAKETQAFTALTNKYSPNREQRRAAKK